MAPGASSRASATAAASTGALSPPGSSQPSGSGEGSCSSMGDVSGLAPNAGRAVGSVLAAHASGASSADGSSAGTGSASAGSAGSSSTGSSSICTDTVGGGSVLGCRASSRGALPNGVPHSEQNFAAGGFSAAQLWQVLCAGAASGALGGGAAGVAGALRTRPPSMAASTAAHPRGREAGGGVVSGTGAGGGVELAPFVTSNPASAASSALSARPLSSSERVGSEVAGGVSGCLVASACGAGPAAGLGASSDPSLYPQVVQRATPGSLYDSHRWQMTPSEADRSPLRASANGARQRRHSVADSEFSMPQLGQVIAMMRNPRGRTSATGECKGRPGEGSIAGLAGG